jgi:pimeloyl-ACP methyl ester carboxylesterase
MQLVFLHGPGAGGCARVYRYQLEHFRGSIAPELPGHLSGARCTSVERYMEWLRGWLWAQGHRSDLVLIGFTLGAFIAMQYALDYPEEVRGLVLMTAALRHRKVPQEALDLRLRAAEDPVWHEQWLARMRELLHFVEPDLREELIESHRKVGPRSQHDDLVMMEQFDVRDRIESLRKPTLLIRGLDAPLEVHDTEAEIHRAVPGSTYLGLNGAGHFPMAEQPAIVNRAIEEFLATLQ